MNDPKILKESSIKFNEKLKNKEKMKTFHKMI